MNAVYNGTHKSLEESEEEFQQHEPAECGLCGCLTQLKYITKVAINIKQSEILYKECCRECRNKIITVVKDEMHRISGD